MLAGFGLTLALCLPYGEASRLAAENKKPKEVWTDLNDPTLPADFKIQGEYVNDAPDSDAHGCQVIALGKGTFQAVVLPGGLPGAGWDGKNKSLMDGKLAGDNAAFKPAAGKKKYLDQSPETFSATSKFPPMGQQDYSATTAGDTLTLKAADGKTVALKKVVRKSPTLGAKPPEGAIVLFDGTDTKEWTGGRLDKENYILNTDGHDILSKRKFNSYTLHVEFLLPYRPDARGQGRGNSGVYMVDHYEVQVLDSFGLDGKDNECGGVYTKAAPKVNMCLPPLVWQTYDIDFTNATRDDSGKKAKNARITAKHNGVLIHDDVEITGPTGGNRSDPEGTPGPVKLQGHGNPLQFRNIWIGEKK